MTIRPRAWLVAIALVALAPMVAGASHLKEQPRKHKTVYHLTDEGACKFCGTRLPGRFQKFGKPFGPRRIPVRLAQPA